MLTNSRVQLTAGYFAYEFIQKKGGEMKIQAYVRKLLQEFGKLIASALRACSVCYFAIGTSEWPPY